MEKINVYLNFDGTTEEAVTFYQSIFGGKITDLQRWKDMPDHSQVPASELNKVMHVFLQIGENLMLNASDSPRSMGFPLTFGNNFSLIIEPKTKADADRYFKLLSDGGKVIMPLEETFWGAYYGMLADRFGVQWQINVDLPKK